METRSLIHQAINLPREVGCLIDPPEPRRSPDQSPRTRTTVSHQVRLLNTNLFFFFKVRISHCSRGDLGTRLGVDLQTFLLLDSGKVYARLIPTRHRAGNTLWDPGLARGSVPFTHYHVCPGSFQCRPAFIDEGLTPPGRRTPRKTRSEERPQPSEGKGLALPFTLSPTHDPGKARSR